MQWNLISLFKKTLFIVLGALFIYSCALLNFDLPGSSIPQTAQTFGVLVVAAILGQTLGLLAVIFYLILGFLGLPVFAHGAGLEVLMGPTKGYLFGFVFSALLCGWWFGQQRKISMLTTLAVMGTAHLLILIMGWVWLSSIMGPLEAFQQGVAPFFYGVIVKSVMATIFVVVYFKYSTKKFQKDFPKQVLKN